MEYCDGESLESLAKTRGSIPEHVLLPIVNQLLDGLEEVHRARLLHLDVKPSNIFLKTDGTVVLLDFGSARQAISSHTKSVKVASAGYAAIEQESVDIDIGKLGPWTDIYGLGATLYRLVTGTRPPSASSRAFQESLVSLEQTKRGQYGLGLLKAIDASLAFKPADRPQAIADFRQLLKFEPPRPVGPAPVPELLSEPKHDRWFLAVVVVVVCAAIIWLTQREYAPDVVDAGSVPDSAPVPIPDTGDQSASASAQCPSDTSLLWNNCIGNGTYDPPYASDAGKLNRYEGFFENNQPAKTGKITYVDGRIYEGEHQALTLNGQGTLWSPDGTKYVGTFKNNAQTGRGTKTWSNGTVAEGRFIDGVLMGKGSLREIDGTRYIGSFTRNKLNGSGVKVTRSDGSEIRQVGDWKDGDLKVGILYVDCISTLKGIFENGKMVSAMELSEADYPCK
jgi:serine/threonine protein kinase